MLKSFDTMCKVCGKVVEQIIEQDEPFENCDCGGEVEKIFGKMTFQLLYDPRKDKVGWAYDGYATSQYWKAMDQAKAEGRKDVVPAHELPNYKRSMR